MSKFRKDNIIVLEPKGTLKLGWALQDVEFHKPRKAQPPNGLQGA